jgi:hypothetical protein
MDNRFFFLVRQISSERFQISFLRFHFFPTEIKGVETLALALAAFYYCGRFISDVLSVNPAAIRHHVSAAIAHLLNALHGYRTGNRPEHTLKILAHHAFVLGIHSGSIHFVRLSVCACNNANRMLLSDRRFVFEIDVMRRNKDKRQDQRDHYVVMEASPRVGPEQITLQCAPNARHVDSLVEVPGRINRLPEVPANIATIARDLSPTPTVGLPGAFRVSILAILVVLAILAIQISVISVHQW